MAEITNGKVFCQEHQTQYQALVHKSQNFPAEMTNIAEHIDALTDNLNGEQEILKTASEVQPTMDELRQYLELAEDQVLTTGELHHRFFAEREYMSTAGLLMGNGSQIKLQRRHEHR